jgi:hypothetical protein
MLQYEEPCFDAYRTHANVELVELMVKMCIIGLLLLFNVVISVDISGNHYTIFPSMDNKL